MQIKSHNFKEIRNLYVCLHNQEALKPKPGTTKGILTNIDEKGIYFLPDSGVYLNRVIDVLEIRDNRCRRQRGHNVQ